MQIPANGNTDSHPLILPQRAMERTHCSYPVFSTYYVLKTLAFKNQHVILSAFLRSCPAQQQPSRAGKCSVGSSTVGRARGPRTTTRIRLPSRCLCPKGFAVLGHRLTFPPQAKGNANLCAVRSPHRGLSLIHNSSRGRKHQTNDIGGRPGLRLDPDPGGSLGLRFVLCERDSAPPPPWTWGVVGRGKGCCGVCGP